MSEGGGGAAGGGRQGGGGTGGYCISVGKLVGWCVEGEWVIWLVDVVLRPFLVVDVFRRYVNRSSLLFWGFAGADGGGGAAAGQGGGGEAAAEGGDAGLSVCVCNMH